MTKEHFTPTLMATFRHRFLMGHWAKWRPWMSDDDLDYVCDKCGGHPW